MTRPSIQALVVEDVQARERVGIERYGKPLDPHNGRDAVMDAYEEALDLVMYLRQVLAERESLSRFMVQISHVYGGQELPRLECPIGDCVWETAVDGQSLGSLVDQADQHLQEAHAAKEGVTS